MNKIFLIAISIGIITFTACSRSYEPINYGKEACAHCKMTIMDDRFASELVDEKGKVFKFDDIICMKRFITEQKKEGNNLVYVEDYLRKKAGVLDATKAVYLHHDLFSTPMKGDYAAFENESDAQKLKDSLGVNVVRWEEVK